jgi:hypothetical protein
MLIPEKEVKLKRTQQLKLKLKCMGKRSFLVRVIGWSLILVIIVLCTAQVGVRASW